MVAKDLNHPPAESFARDLGATNWNGNCGDNIFSGHTVNVMNSFMAVVCYLWGLCVPPGATQRLRWKLVIFYYAAILGYAYLIYVQLWYIIATHNHYTIDVIVALYTGPLLFLVDRHVLMPWEVDAPDDLNLRQLLCDWRSWLPLPLAWTEGHRKRVTED